MNIVAPDANVSDSGDEAAGNSDSDSEDGGDTEEANHKKALFARRKGILTPQE